MTQIPPFGFDNSYARELEGFYVPWEGDKAPTPKLVAFNDALARELKLDAAALRSDAGAAIFAGSEAPIGAIPLAQAYAGHQFGGFSPQLGDGRAILLGEVIDRYGARRDIHLKGSGRTPFSRGGDGKAVLGPVLREYLMGEAMHALGVPTTRALAAVTTGEDVMRDGPKPGAVLARVASSHLRVGTFQFFAAHQEEEKVKQLADYAIARHYPALANHDAPYLALLEQVAMTQARLVAHWVSIGFVHGVMNTDNMTISGETIDYGPCAFIDFYDPKAVFSSIDQNGRYAYGNQPVIAQWNIARLAETLLHLIDPKDDDNAVRLATNVINAFSGLYLDQWSSRMRSKLGLASAEDGDIDLINGLHSAMEGQNVDFTRAFRALSDAGLGKEDAFTSLFLDRDKAQDWLTVWKTRLKSDPQGKETRAAAMKAVNPVYIPRNHLVEAALQAAESNGDFAPFERLSEVLSNPYTERAGLDEFARGAPDDFGPYVTYCGT